MKILTIESNSTGDAEQDEFSDWPVELRDAFEEADVVIFLFSPFAHTILKGPGDLVVTDVRRALPARSGWEFYAAQRDLGDAKEEASRVREQRKRPGN